VLTHGSGACRGTAMMDKPALEATGLFKRYGDHHAVSGVDLVVRPGQVHGLLGPNGAGKTTLMRIVLGLVRPDAGTVRLLGESAGTTPLPDGVAGFVDAPRFYPYLSGRRNLRLVAGLDGRSSSRETGRIDDVLGQVGLAAQADAKVGGYSAGMRQRLGLAAALLRSPKLLLLDEPTHSLDPAGARDLRARVRRLASDGVAILLSSHDMAEVEDLCGALTILHRGRVAFAGTVDDLRKRAPGAVHRLRTSDDERALSIAGAQVTVAADGDGLDVCAGERDLDPYVIALGQAGIAVRSLESRDRSLESLFLRLTADGADPEPPPAAPPHDAAPRDAPRSAESAASARGALAVARAESAKLAAQLTAWALLAACFAGPFAFAAAMKVQSSIPEDTLFGRSVKASGFAVPLVVLGFAASWAFPVLTSVVAGDLFSAEDRYGTWPTVLTRSRTRGEIFAGKVLTAMTFSLVAVTVLAIGSVLAGIVVIGGQPLLGLSGTQLAAGRALALVLAAWGSVLPPVLAFTALAILLSVATRSSAAGIGLPVLAGFAMELASFLNGPEVVRRMLLTPPFVAWHGLFTEHAYYGPLVEGTAISCAYLIASLAGAYRLVRERDMGG
jgi:ABC-type multidrug transport system ATPase subunit/ABC-type transport system involved in multi-copper enzyme maturation permease subunit